MPRNLRLLLTLLRADAVTACGAGLRTAAQCGKAVSFTVGGDFLERVVTLDVHVWASVAGPKRAHRPAQLLSHTKCFKLVSQKSFSAQIRRLVLHISNGKG